MPLDRLVEQGDASLISRIASGDIEAFKTLHQTFQRRLFAYSMKMLDDVSAAEELTSDVLFEVWKQAAQFKGKSKLSTWIFGIARHKALNELRRKGHRTDVTLEHAVATADARPDPEESAERRNSVERLESAMQQLSPDHREVIELTFYHEFSYKEIAEIMNCPVSTVKTRMFYAKQKMRETLSLLESGQN